MRRAGDRKLSRDAGRLRRENATRAGTRRPGANHPPSPSSLPTPTASVGSSCHDEDAVPVVPPQPPRHSEARGGPRETLLRRLLNKPQHGKRAYLRDLAVYVPPAEDFITKAELKAAIKDSVS